MRAIEKTSFPHRMEGMMAELDDQAQTRLTLVSLFGALVQTLDGQYPGLATDFNHNLEQIHNQFKNWDHPPDKAIEAIRWTFETVKNNR
jgi:hypothetical protein